MIKNVTPQEINQCILFYNDFSVNTIAEDIITRVDQVTGVLVNYRETTISYNGTSISSLDCDDVIYLEYDNKFYKRQFEGPVNVMWFGAIGNGLNDDTNAFINAINYCKKTAGELYIPEGVFHINQSLYFDDVIPVNNTGKFGIKIIGAGLRTIIKFFGTSQILFDLFSTADIQVEFRDFVVMDGSYDSNYAFRFGKIDRYSKFQNIRILQFGTAMIFQSPLYRITFNDIFIRDCKYTIIADSSQLGFSNVLTEFVFNRCYIDNNGRINSNTNHMVLYNCQEFKFNDCIFEGNFSYGMNITGASENIIFDKCRFEETEVNTENSSGHIHNISETVNNVTFTMCEIAYNKKGTTSNKNYSLFYIGNNAKFIDCQFIDLSNENPENTFGITPDSAIIQIINPYLGIGNNYKVRIPKRYQFVKIGNIFVWEHDSQSRSKIGFPLNDSDGQLGIL